MSFSNNKVTDFLEKLSQQAPKQRDESRMNLRSLDKIFLNFNGNFGRYQILPMDSVVTDYPFVTLFNTYEVNVKRRSVAADGTEQVHDAWIRLFDPNSGAYQMKDMTGRVVSSLTTSDLELIQQSRALFDELFEELDAKNNRDEMVTTLIRKRNYTIFFGHCLSYWKGDSRTPSRQNFSGLFVVTAKQFIKNIQDNINDKSLMNDGDVSWISNIYNRNLTGRDGFLMFSITDDKSRPGYIITTNHEWGRAKQLENTVIPEEDAELMVDPVATFLGWQAPKEQDGENPVNRRLFNPAIYKEACVFLSEQISAVKMAKNLGTDLKDAIDATVAKTLAAQPSRGQQKTNDPILQQQNAQQQQAYTSPNVGADPARVVAQTTPETVISNPAAAHLDPVSGMPVNDTPNSNANPFGGGNQQTGTTQAPPFGQPSFGSGFGAGFGQGFGK